MMYKALKAWFERAGLFYFPDFPVCSTLAFAGKSPGGQLVFTLVSIGDQIVLTHHWPDDTGKPKTGFEKSRQLKCNYEEFDLIPFTGISADQLQ